MVSPNISKVYKTLSILSIAMLKLAMVILSIKSWKQTPEQSNQASYFGGYEDIYPYTTWVCRKGIPKLTVNHHSPI
jgi:hypothetical protein